VGGEVTVQLESHSAPPTQEPSPPSSLPPATVTASADSEVIPGRQATTSNQLENQVPCSARSRKEEQQLDFVRPISQDSRETSRSNRHQTQQQERGFQARRPAGLGTQSGESNLFSYSDNIEERMLPADQSDLGSTPSSGLVIAVDSEQASEKLELYTRQWYICTFSNENVDQPVRAVFPGMPSNNQIYQNAVTRVRQLYKSFKSRTLADADKWFKIWTNSRENAKYLGITNIKTLQLALYESFEPKFVSFVFSWSKRAISFEACSSNAQEFLQCMTCPLFMESDVADSC
jgi:hypothetical protein